MSDVSRSVCVRVCCVHMSASICIRRKSERPAPTVSSSIFVYECRVRALKARIELFVNLLVLVGPLVLDLLRN